MVQGNLEGIRASVIAEMEELLNLELEEDQFAPPELVAPLSRLSDMIRREISVYISRAGDIMDITVGGIDSVPLPEVRMRRSRERLCGVRCLHTHPGGNPELSDVDLSALVNYRLDAMASIGVLNGRATGIQAAFLADRVQGVPVARETEIFAISRIPQREWMEQIQLSDQMMAKTSSQVQADRPEQAILVGIENEESLEELADLAKTAGAVVVSVLLQKRDKPDNATYIGSGKAERLALDAQALDADLIIFDDELSGAQTRNLENILGVKVIDRTTLILDIFAQRAQSRAGKLQVEMAQLAYRLPRLIGEGIALSRLGGGIGTRGPGETRLEISRRRIRKRLSDLRNQVDELSRQRGVQRIRREKNQIPVVALVGYTNTGKSTLLNRLSDAGVMAADMLFATLDPVSRRVELPEGRECLLVDTVGFIHKLPHALVDAFRSTLEEAALADLLLIINDASNPDLMKQRDVVLGVLAELGAQDKPVIDVLNKTDKGMQDVILPGSIPISALNGQGIDALLSSIENRLNAGQKTATLLVPYEKGAVLSQLYNDATVLSQDYEESGTKVRVRMDASKLERVLSQGGVMLLKD